MHERSLPAVGPLVLAAALVALWTTNAGAQRAFDPERHGHLWPETDFSRHSVPLSEIFMSGVPRDGIPPIDDPVTGALAEADKVLGETEPVIAVHLNGAARAYPLGVLMRHEIVNDNLGGVPIAVTFCPLCNSAVVFDRRVDGQILDFGVTGNLRHSDLVMWDRQTESWWQQFVGEAIVGEMTGTLLEMIPVRVESYSRFRERFPDGTANLGSKRFGGFNQAYLFNPYEYYDSASRPMLFFGEPPDDIAPLAYVVAVGDEAWSLNLLRERRRVEAGDLVITWEPGQNAVMDAPIISEGRDIGNVTVQRRTDKGLVDAVHDVTFAFSFNAFHPDGAIHQ
ncbi:MAG: DUF3179 domain-containing protein [Alphaproteobacteria bacterium]